jgi:hypothetical protein
MNKLIKYLNSIKDLIRQTLVLYKLKLMMLCFQNSNKLKQRSLISSKNSQIQNKYLVALRREKANLRHKSDRIS